MLIANKTKHPHQLLHYNLGVGQPVHGPDCTSILLVRSHVVVIDIHTKRIDVFPMTTATATTTIQQLRTLFAHFGIPDIIVSDNGPQFSAVELQQFCCLNGIRHSQVAPYHPLSNGLAERAKKFQRGIKETVSWNPPRSYYQTAISIQDHSSNHNLCCSSRVIAEQETKGSFGPPETTDRY